MNSYSVRNKDIMLKRRAVTVIEVLVCVAIISLLLALLLPAIQKVREAANKMWCAGNLRQLAIANYGYHNDYSRFPPGYLGPSLINNENYPANLSEGQWMGHLPLLLPYIESDAISTKLQILGDLAVTTRSPWFHDPSTTSTTAHAVNYTMGMKKITLFLCPSALDQDPVPGTGPFQGGTILGLHIQNNSSQGPFTYGWKDDYVLSAPYRFLGKTNYAGSAGCGTGSSAYFNQYRGVFTNRSRVSAGQMVVADGTSNTLFYGETVGTKWDTTPINTVNCSWMGCGALGTYLGLARGTDGEAIMFSSAHTSGVQFSFADGSVRTLRFLDYSWLGPTAPGSAKWKVLQQLAGYQDGQSGSPDVIIE